MWSVVTLSPSIASTLAPRISSMGWGLLLDLVEVRRSENIGRIGIPPEGAAVDVSHAGPAFVALNTDAYLSVTWPT